MTFLARPRESGPLHTLPRLRERSAERGPLSREWGNEKRQRRQRDKNLAFAGGENFFEGQMAFAFLGLEIARREEAAEPAISGAIGRIGQHLETIDRHEPRADEELYFSFFRFVIGAHHAGKRVAVGDADGGKTQAASAVATISCGCEAPRRKEKLVVTASSA